MGREGVSLKTKPVSTVVRTPFNLVGQRIVPHEWRLGFRDLHQAILVDFRQCEVLFVPCQVAARSKSPC